MASFRTSWSPVSRLERLPPELMDMVLYETALDLADISRLSRTNRALHWLLLQRLLATEKLRNQAMWWALTQNLDGLVHKAVLHGAPASTHFRYARWTALGARVEGTGQENLTLDLAAMHKSAGAFHRLIEVGTRVDCLGADGRRLARHIVCPTSTEFLRIFLDNPGPRAADGLEMVADTPPLVSQLQQYQLDEMLYRVVDMQNYREDRYGTCTWTASSCLDFAKRLLSAGARPNPNWIFLEEPSSQEDHDRQHRGIFLPTLSVAIMTRSASLVRLLLDSGASVDALDRKFFAIREDYKQLYGGQHDPYLRLDRLYRPRLAYHGPMFAVAYALARGLYRDDGASVRATEFQQLVDIANMCLARGAKLAVRLPVQVEWVMRYYTPLMIYLSAVRDWTPCRDTQPGSDAIQRLRYLLELDANPAVIEEDIATERLPWIGIHRSGENILSMMPSPRDIPMELEISPAQILLGSWSCQSSAIPPLILPLKLLLGPKGWQTDGIRPFDLLASYRYGSLIRRPSDADISAWNSILTDVIQDMSPSDLNRFLADYIILKATCDDSGGDEASVTPYSSGDSPGYDADDGLVRPTIRRLVAAGADVNHLVGGEGGATPLKCICFWILSINCRPGVVWDSDSPNVFGLMWPRVRLLHFLINECGADPATDCQGWTLPNFLVRVLEGEDTDSE
ncbi:hypothetical protein GGTG_02118 [Gaeumannomyces tritici R3-111a-1]|uniref:Uncharacterized protein n=1 Tax=Gaeumannomyces tritici (strain R3-111a-1) TaxID=644352 RepID=J3NLG9_GAET3|nr:hypothetical protein GGTG_02118 [Gaeumannomyces tritici R3-111a-1]EJT82144.1 hypothetical protein GGTG_02118 [Gaeumannomyces tritici R3-111a-1]